MPESPQVEQAIITWEASDLAFKIGNVLERTIVRRTFELAKAEVAGEGRAVVTVDHVRRVLHDSLLKDVCTQIGIVFDGDTQERFAA